MVYNRNDKKESGEVTLRERAIYRGAKNNDLTQINSELLLQILRKKGTCSRVELAKETGLTQAGITKLVSSMIEQQIVRETGILGQNERGRKSIGLQINEELGKVVCVNISMTFMKVAIYDVNGNVYNNVTIPLMQFHALDDAMLHLTDLIKEYTVAFPDIKSIGIALPAACMKRSGGITFPDSAYDWNSFRPLEALEERFHMPIYPIHDADAAAYSYKWRSDMKPHKTLVYMLLGEEVSAGLVVDDKLFEGSFGNAAQIGHVSIDINGRKCSCGNRGCLERYCSTGALVEDAKRAFAEHPESGLSQYKNLTYFDIFNEYEKMDPLAVSLVTQACCYAGYGVVNLIHAYNPDVVVLGNVLTRAKDALEENVRKVLAERISPELVEKVEIRTEEPGSNSVLYGCAMYAIDHLIDSVLAQ